MIQRQHETAVLITTDHHYGKKTSTFTPEVYEQRLASVAARICAIQERMQGYAFDKLVVMMLGDVVDGGDIYPTQAHHQAESNADEQADACSTLLADWLRTLGAAFGTVEVEAVPGNHGRAGWRVHENTNWDMVTYRYLRLKLEKDGIPVRWNESGDLFIRSVKIRNSTYLLYHGQEIKSYQGIPWYGMLNRMNRWATSSMAPFHVMTMGHFHSLGAWKLNSVTLLSSGTMVSDDEWALRSFGWESANQWWFVGVSDSRPITWQFAVDLI